MRFQIPVLIEVEPDRIAVKGARPIVDDSRLVERLVEKGLRGQLQFDSLLTGELYVDLDFHPEEKPALVAKYGDYEVIPTMPAQLEALTTKITNVLDKVDAIPLDQIGRDLSATAAGANALVNSAALKQSIVELEGTLAQARATAARLNTEIAPELANTLRESAATLKNAKTLISDSSPLTVEMQRMFQEVSGAAHAVRLMADYLERHPEALLQGKGRGR